MSFKRISTQLKVCLVLCLFFLFLSQPVWAQEPEPENESVHPLTLGYQGYLVDEGQEVFNGERGITFKLYDAANNGNVIWEEVVEAVSVTNGYFAVNLGLRTPLPVDFDMDTPLFLGVQVEGDVEISPRLRVGGAVRSQWAEKAIRSDLADHAVDVSGEVIHPASVSIGEQLVINEEGEWVGPAIEGTGVQGEEGTRAAIAPALGCCACSCA